MRTRVWITALALLLAACGKKAPAPTLGEAGSAAPAPAKSTVSAPAACASNSPLPDRALPSAEFARLFRELSEPDRYFSDNEISNETSYLDVAPILQRLPREHTAYLGVGPEQNFSYIALLEPELALVIDIRRDNALLHLLYKSCFDEARSRSQFLALLIGRELAGRNAGDDASIDSVLADVERAPQNKDLFVELHRRLVERIEQRYGITLSDKDRERLQATHQAFFDAGLGIRFELHSPSSRMYPTLHELLRAIDRSGSALGFLASERLFRIVQRLERENRVIPVVGNFAGEHALKAIAKELELRKLTVSAFYVSNVEQYLLTPPLWKAWVSNVAALPRTADSIFVRAYLDQGRRHPRQQPGQRSVTVAQPLATFPTAQTPPPNLYTITTQGLIEP